MQPCEQRDNVLDIKQSVAKIKQTLCFLICLTLCGCMTFIDMDKGSTAPADSVAVVVGLTLVDPDAYRGWDGYCAGSDADLNRMALACKEAGIQRVVTLYNEKATVYAVMRQILLASKALTPAVQAGKNPLLLIYISGHGGQIYDFFRTEKDSQNQTMCLWDGQLVDDLMWDVLRKIPKGIRVVHITDTCNSGTNYRSVPEIISRSSADIVKRARLTRRLPEQLSCDFIHFGGCADGKSSFGKVGRGGLFTYSLLVDTGWQGNTYEEWFEKGKKNMPQVNQIPVMTVIQTQESIFNNGRMEKKPALK